VINAMKWKDPRISYTKIIDKVAKQCKQQKDGSSYTNIASACRANGFKAFIRRYPSIDFIRQQLLKGKSIILLYRHPKDFWPEYNHFVFIPEYNKEFTVVNGHVYDNLEEERETVVMYDDHTFNNRISKRQRHAVIVLS